MLEGKVAIVTGANQGIGKEVSKRLAECGVHLILVSNKSDELKEVKKDLDTYNVDILDIALDVRNKAEVDSMVDKAVSQFGKVDILVNNAGVTFFGGVEECTEEEWDLTLNTNVKGYFLLSKAVLPYMKEKKSGTIINMSSIWGKKGSATMVAYSTSKFAVEGLTNSLEEEVKPYGIKVSSIILDKVDTPFRDNMVHKVNFSDEQKEKMIAASDVADSVLWILESSERSLPSSITLNAFQW